MQPHPAVPPLLPALQAEPGSSRGLSHTAAAQKGMLKFLQTISPLQIFQFSDMNTTSHFIPSLILLIAVYLLMASSVLFRMII